LTNFSAQRRRGANTFRQGRAKKAAGSDFGGQMPRFRGFEAEIEEIEAAIEAESFVLGAPVGPGVGANTRRRRRIVVDIPMHSNE
jgi:hypothetical protein